MKTHGTLWHIHISLSSFHVLYIIIHMNLKLFRFRTYFVTREKSWMKTYAERRSNMIRLTARKVTLPEHSTAQHSTDKSQDIEGKPSDSWSSRLCRDNVITSSVAWNRSGCPMIMTIIMKILLHFSSRFRPMMFYYSSVFSVLIFLFNSINLEIFVTPLNARLFVHIVSWGHGMG